MKVELKEMMEIATFGYVCWPFFDAIVSKKLIRYNMSPIDLQIIHIAFNMFCNKGDAHYNIVLYNTIKTLK